MTMSETGNHNLIHPEGGKGKRFRFFFSLLFSLIFFIIAAFHIFQARPTIQFDVLKPGATGFETVTISLSGETPAAFFQADIVGNYAIQNLTLKYLFHKRQWLANQLPKFFSRQKNVKQLRSKKRMLLFKVVRPGATLNPDEDFGAVGKELQASAKYYFLLTTLASLLLFFLVSRLDPRWCKTLLKSRGFVNMAFPFVAVLFFFLFNYWFSFLPGKSIFERRPIARKVEFRPDQLFNFTRPFTVYHSDHFPLRGTLIYLNNLLKHRMFEVSGMKQVLLGKEGWLFLDNNDRKAGTVEYFRNASPLAADELEHWRLRLEERHNWLAARGVRYLFILAPNKNTIYPEYMPDRIRKASKLSRMDQLLNHLRARSHIAVLDLRPALLAEKKNRLLYHITDTHWNDFGAFIAYREIMRYLAAHFPEFKNAPIMPLSDFRIEMQLQPGGDLAEMLFLEQRVINENWLRMEPLKPFTFTGDALPDLPTASRHGYTLRPGAPLPNIVMVHDSFCKKWRPYFSEMFSRIVYIWDWGAHFYPKIIEAEKPALVIDEMVERFLMEKKLENPKEIQQELK